MFEMIGQYLVLTTIQLSGAFEEQSIAFQIEYREAFRHSDIDQAMEVSIVVNDIKVMLASRKVCMKKLMA